MHYSLYSLEFAEFIIYATLWDHSTFKYNILP